MNQLTPLAPGAVNCIRWGNVQAGELVLLLVEPATDELVIEAISFAAKSAGAEVSVLVKEPRPFGEQLSPIVAGAMKAADLVYDFGGPSSHSEAGFLAGFDYGTRYTLVRPEAETLTTESALLPTEIGYYIGNRVQTMIRANPSIRVTDGKGTDFRIRPTPGSVGGFIGPRPYEPGLAVPGYISTFPGLSTVFGDLDYTANGKLVLDKAMVFDAPSVPITFTVEDGWVTDVSGGPEAEVIREAARPHKNGNRLAEVGMGLNPKVPLRLGSSPLPEARAVNIMQMTRRAGTLFVAMGGNHLLGGTDPSKGTPQFGIIVKPTITAGDSTLVSDGKLVLAEEPDQELVELCEKYGGTKWLTQA